MKKRVNLISSILVIILAVWNLYSVMIPDGEYSALTVLFVGFNIYLFSVSVENIAEYFSHKKKIPSGIKQYSNLYLIKSAKGSELVFISQISRFGDKTTDLSEVDMTHNDDVYFDINCLSLTNETYIASGYNSYVVKLKTDL